VVLGRVLAAVFAGDRRVWRATLLCALPLAGLIAFYVLRPVDYNTGSDSVGVIGYVAPVPAGRTLCIGGLEIPPQTARLRLELRSATRSRPTLTLALHVGAHTLRSRIGSVRVGASRTSAAVFTVPGLASEQSVVAASACLTARRDVSWGGAPLPSVPSANAPAIDGQPLAARIAVWYQPARGLRRSYISQLGSILARASLFRPAPVGPWLYVIVLFLVLPALALLAVRCLALAATGVSPRRVAVWLYLIAAVNFACWGLISPVFQTPDEVDHFAYTQSLVERGREPAREPTPALARWSRQESLLLEYTAFPTDHQVGDTTVPWLGLQQRRWEAAARRLRPSAANGGGNETAATHGPIYYAALAPAYALASGSPSSQLTLMRMASALIGALTVLFAFLMVRELAPGRPWLAVLAALLVAFQPMYGFISGSVNNDVGVNACAAALELLLIRILRRGITLPTGLLTGALIALLPLVKGTGLSLYPVAAVALLFALWQEPTVRGRAQAWLALAVSAVVLSVLLPVVFSGFSPPTAAGGAASVGSNVRAASDALNHHGGFASYVWQVFLPRLPFMGAHFPPGQIPAWVIFVERGWADFGWSTVLFPAAVYSVLGALMLTAIGLALFAAVREWPWLKRNWKLAVVVLATPVCVFLGFEATFYLPAARGIVPEFGRYEFPAIAPLAAIVVGALHAFGRRRALTAGAVVLVAMIAFSVASELLTLTTFYA
jgi:hypothetical protein